MLSTTHIGRLYLAGLVDRDTGRYDRAAIRAEIRKLTTRFWAPMTFPAALALVLNEARIEHASVSDAIEWRKRWAAREAIIDRDAGVLAATFGYEIDRLQFEIDRRNFGSFTTTLSGSPNEQARYRRALAIAKAKRDAAKIAAE